MSPMGQYSIAMEEHAGAIRKAIQPLAEGDALAPGEIADRVALSRFHFHRVFKRILGETPGEMRRRLLLERAAWLLAKTAVPATEAAFEAGFESLEGFSRAFRKAFGVSPSRFASAGLPLWLASPNGVHFSPLVERSPGAKPMDLIDRLLATESDSLRTILDQLSGWTDSQWDESLPFSVQEMCYEDRQATVRQLLDWYLLTMEAWIAAVDRQGFPAERNTTREGIASRAEIALPMFEGLVRRVREADEWNAEFTDELCDPPARFSFGGMIAHVITHNLVRRQALLAALRQRSGLDAWGDPLHWEQSQPR